MSNTNSVIPYSGALLKDLADSIGITQFPDDTSWYQVIGGLIIQGGKIAIGGGVTQAIDFVAPYEKQLLSIHTEVTGAAPNGHYITNEDLTGFDIVNGASGRDYYWWSVGV